MAGTTPFAVAEALDRAGVESRAGCHCATLAHRALGLDPPASCRLSFSLYNTAEDIDHATHALARIVKGARTGRPHTDGHRPLAGGPFIAATPAERLAWLAIDGGLAYPSGASPAVGG